MGQSRKQKVKYLIDLANKRGWTERGLARKLKHEANTPTMRDDRNWKMVARTELTDKNARQALDNIIQEYGPKVKVYRETVGDSRVTNICDVTFGKPYRPKLYVAGEVEDEIKGALHIGCRTKPWEVARTPTGRIKIQKAFKTPEFMYKMRFVIAGHLKPKKKKISKRDL